MRRSPPCPKFLQFAVVGKHSYLPLYYFFDRSSALMVPIKDFAHGLIQYIKTAGLVLIVDTVDSNDISSSIAQPTTTSPAAVSALQTFYGIPDGVDGFLRGNGVLKFNESIDM